MRLAGPTKKLSPCDECGEGSVPVGERGWELRRGVGVGAFVQSTEFCAVEVLFLSRWW